MKTIDEPTNNCVAPFLSCPADWIYQNSLLIDLGQISSKFHILKNDVTGLSAS